MSVKLICPSQDYGPCLPPSACVIGTRSIFIKCFQWRGKIGTVFCDTMVGSCVTWFAPFFCAVVYRAAMETCVCRDSAAETWMQLERAAGVTCCRHEHFALA